MISLRYHIVSLVAVFLALALGIVVGSTVLQEGTVSVLRATSEAVRAKSEENSRKNVELTRQIGDLQRFGAAILPELVQNRLKGRPVVLVDTDKVDSGMRDSVRKVLEEAGAEVDGQITFANDRLALGADADRTAIGRLLAADAGAADVLRGELVRRLANRLATPAAIPQDNNQRASDMLTSLQDADFLALKLSRPLASGADPFPRQGSVFVLLGPSAAATATAVAPDAFLVPLADQVSARTGGPVAGGVAAAVAVASSWITALRNNRAVSRRVSGIDSVDTVYGQLALVEALQGSLQQLPAGQYGIKDGASGLLPERIDGS
ncbi:MAG TPA: copper transporter [Actinomycetota bacterium]|nr:copper transporter [Actinomycetota bacterium]